jgi:hypothetical protein
MDERGHPPCPRCYTQDPVSRPWRGFRVARALWLAGLGGIVLLIPFYAFDIVLLMPMTMAYLLACGPVFGLAAQEPTCSRCGLARPKPGWHETPCRPVRGLEAPSALRMDPQPEREETSGVRELPAH